jgi:hypothetical protein
MRYEVSEFTANFQVAKTKKARKGNISYHRKEVVMKKVAFLG